MTAKARLKLRIVVLITCVLFLPLTFAQETSVREKPVRKDRYGDLLPEHALVRIGSKRSRQDLIVAMHFLNHNRTLLAIDRGGTVRARDSATGRDLWQFNASSNQAVNTAFFTEDGQRLLIVHMGQGVIWDTMSGHIVTTVWQKMRTSGVAFSADGSLVAAETEEDLKDGIAYAIKIWDAGSGKLMVSIPKRNHQAGILAFAEDGRTLIRLEERGGAIQRWDCASGHVKSPEWRQANPIYRFFASDSGKLAGYVERELLGEGSSAPARFMSVLNLDSGNAQVRLHNAGGQIRCMAFSSNDERVYAADYDSIHCWNLMTGQVDPSWEMKSIGTCAALALSGDGQVLATAAADGPIRFFDVQNRRELSPQDFPTAPIMHVAVSPNRQLLATNCLKSASIELWDGASGQKAKQLMLNGETIVDLQFGESNSTLLVGCDTGVTRLFSVDSGMELRSLPGIRGLVLDKGSTWVAAGLKGTLLVGDFQSGRVRRQWTVHAGTLPLGQGASANSFVTWCGDQSKDVVPANDQSQSGTRRRGDSLLSSWDMNTGKQLQQVLPSSKTNLPDGRVTASALAIDNRHLVVSGWSGNMIALGEMASGTFRQVEAAGPKVMVHKLCFSPDGLMFASAWSDGTVRLWEVASGGELACLTGHTEGVNDLVFSKDGKQLISASADATTLVWDVESCIRPTSDSELLDLTVLQLWQRLESTDPKTALNAVRRLTVNPEGAISMIEKHLNLVDDARVKQLLTDLDSKVFRTRESADIELTSMGELVKERLELTLKESKSAEVAYRCRKILRKLAAYPLERKRAMQVLEWINSDRARSHLKKLAAGPKDFWLTETPKLCSIIKSESGEAGKSPSHDRARLLYRTS